MAHIPLELIVASAEEHGIEPGWLWLYLNGFKRRVPPAIKEKIVNDVFGVNGIDADGLRKALTLQELREEEVKEGTE